MSSAQDLEINRGIRRVFVKHWIDLGRLSIRTGAGRAIIRGTLQRIPGAGGELTPAIVENMFHEMERLPGVERVTSDLSNWNNSGGAWRPTADTSAMAKRAAAMQPQTYTVQAPVQAAAVPVEGGPKT